MKELWNRAVALEKERNFGEAAAAWAQLSNATEGELAEAGLSGVDVRKRQAGAEYRAGNFGNAIRILEAIPGVDRDVEVLGLLVRARLEAGRYEQAAETAERALVLDPDSVQLRHLLGRAFMRQAEQMKPSESALLWQRSIDQFTDILVIFNPNDEIARDLKLTCVRKRNDFFGDTMRSEFSRFAEAVERGEMAKAGDILAELIRIVIEHAIDILDANPNQTIRIARDFIAMVETYSARSTVKLASLLGPVFAQLHCLSMWAQVWNEDAGAAELSLERALRIAPDKAFAWMSKAQLMFVLGRGKAVEEALGRANEAIASEHDKLYLAATYQLIGEFDKALAWVDKVELEKLKREAHRPDRAEQTLRRTRAEIMDEKEMGIVRSAEEILSGDLSEPLKRVLGGATRQTGRPVPPGGPESAETTPAP